MRILVYALILMSFCGIQAHSEGNNSSLREKILSAKSEAIQDIRKYSNAIKNDDPSESKMTDLMADLLGKSSTTEAVGDTLRDCQEPKFYLLEFECGIWCEMPECN